MYLERTSKTESAQAEYSIGGGQKAGLGPMKENSTDLRESSGTRTKWATCQSDHWHPQGPRVSFVSPVLGN